MDICSCFISGEIISSFEMLKTKCPAVSFRIRTIAKANNTDITSEFDVLCVEEAAKALRPCGIETGSTILLEGAQIYLKKDEKGVLAPWLRVQHATQVRLMNIREEEKLDDGVIQASEAFI